MQIRNGTHWRTDQLRQIVARVAADELEVGKRRSTIVVIGYNRAAGHHTYSSGHAPYGGSIIYVNIPSGAVNSIDFAMVVAHEFAHSRGLHHRDVAMFGNPRYHRVAEHTNRIYAWAAEMPIEKKQVEKISYAELIDKRYKHVLSMTARAQSRAKRAQTILKKWTAKRRYYEKKMAAMKMPK
jgi:hypothetical protein